MTDSVRGVEEDQSWILVLPDPAEAVTHLRAEADDRDSAQAPLDAADDRAAPPIDPRLFRGNAVGLDVTTSAATAASYRPPALPRERGVLTTPRARVRRGGMVLRAEPAGEVRRRTE